MQQQTEEKEYVFVSATSPTSTKLRDSLTSSAVFLVASPTSSSSGATERCSIEHDADGAAAELAALALDALADTAAVEIDQADACIGVAEGDESDDSVELDDMPMVLPFLPALDASTQITKFEGFSEAISDAQQLLDSRLLAYSQYQQMVRLSLFL